MPIAKGSPKVPGSGRKPQPIRHGTHNGYKTELRRGLPTCPACRKAWSAYCTRNNEMRKELKAKGVLKDYREAREVMKQARIHPPKQEYEA